VQSKTGVGGAAATKPLRQIVDGQRLSRQRAALPAGRVKGAYGALRGRFAPPDPPARSQDPAAIRDREQTQPSPDHGDNGR
jgi:hypothetical protein